MKPPTKDREMKSTILTCSLALLTVLLPVLPETLCAAASITLAEPLDYQVIQRSSPAAGTVRLRGVLKDLDADGAILEVRIVQDGRPGPWRRVEAKIFKEGVQGALEVPAGGWYRMDVRVSRGEKVLAETSVAHVGVGEIFVVAGQSNSANHGEEKQTTKSGRVAAFDGRGWRPANDPQPGASGGGGSFLPPLGDALAERFSVPVGFVACGIGATSVREWLPKGATFANPPTIEGRVSRLADGTWQSKGDAFAMFTGRMKPLGPHGFRAVLWHQGESDANQRDPARTLPGKLYREYLERLIRGSRRAIGWDAPWFVAQVSYHVPGDESSPDIRAAQVAVCKGGLALEGPDSDALKGELRERGGTGVHFSGKGLRAHAAKWAERVIPWLERELAGERK